MITEGSAIPPMVQGKSMTSPPSNKGKETATPSIASKIARSASGLAKGAVGSSDVSGASHALDLNSKSFNGSSSRAANHWLQDIPSHVATPSASGQSGSSYQSFRSSPVREPDDRAINEFLNGSPESLSFELDHFEPLEERDVNDSLPWMFPEPGASSTDQDVQNVHTGDQSENDQALRTMHTPYEENEIQDDQEIEEFWHTHVSAKLGESHNEQNTTDTHEAAWAENISLMRLNMILGHVTEKSSLISARDFASGLIHQEPVSAHHVAIDHIHKIQQEHIQAIEAQEFRSQTSKNISSNQVVDQTSSRIQSTHVSHAKNVNQVASPENVPSEPEFHCARAVCRERFKDPAAIRPYPGARWGYKCPHDDCTAQFQTYNKWTVHISQPHHR
ncbi:hypothetical protein BU24DRAFT_493811 [Aaosphaeria arxii CBS 175.79]|uniref:C2H2-type domain-containing protein n=1 Tax=Aaosphaeria arxii CBS 175.79 TaxID=1450172 RepID=A0A6A5XK76_9PLEO|nr:uncharacterized protein BU24DRAFT_493811 [Aaosphaeria arxii CBS 175.79]KAF2013286.1 hypothetical protein BU24DRAFT_493811 [Aaosphaeria arxii CBS 175.79]